MLKDGETQERRKASRQLFPFDGVAFSGSQSECRTSAEAAKMKLGALSVMFPPTPSPQNL